jgi:hypothetical protein
VDRTDINGLEPSEMAFQWAKLREEQLNRPGERGPLDAKSKMENGRINQAKTEGPTTFFGNGIENNSETNYTKFKY